MDNSELHIRNGQITAYVGLDATRLYRVRTLKSFIDLHKKTGMKPTRGVTITKMFKMAKEYTGQTYKRGEHDRAVNDLNVWIANMMAALPVVEG
jgi:hypothetical protein